MSESEIENSSKRLNPSPDTDGVEFLDLLDHLFVFEIV